ncbi:MAG: glutamate-5-semialdehyde dehydrogenase [Abditibacteriota bacterium]|nr:glutamate-5-semialdehyde dehydrogenase [Abditibacteriota bacterium]
MSHDTQLHGEIEALAQRAKAASEKLRTLSTAVKNAALMAMAEALLTQQERILAANVRDLENGRTRGLSEAMLDRLKLNPARLEAMAEGCRQVAALPDPIGAVISGGNRPNGLQLQQLRVPLGVIGIIYEARPNVTVDAAILCLKSGNAVILRGGTEAFESNKVLCEVIAQAAEAKGIPQHAIAMIETTDRAATAHLVTMTGLVDLVIPRGGSGLKKSLMEVAKVPVIFAAGGVCHAFVDESADARMASDIVFNAKVQRPSTCNALETLLVHQSIAATWLPVMADRLMTAGVELRGDERARAIVPAMQAASESDWDEEYGTLILAVCVVDDVEAAMAHIGRHGSGHSETIITADYFNAEAFCARLDAAAVYVNASTRFTDGFEFGMGAEIGISTQKLHARGPMGLEALTSTKWVVRGHGQTRA